MARIRSIKPEFWSSEQVMSCSRDARLLFIGLWNFVDDEGRISNSAKSIKAQVYPSDEDINSETVRRWIDELSARELVLQYEVAGRLYLQVTGWHHQKIDRKRPSKLPPPSLGDFSTMRQRALAPDLILSDLNRSDLKSETEKTVSGGSLASAHRTGALASPPAEPEPAAPRSSNPKKQVMHMTRPELDAHFHRKTYADLTKPPSGPCCVGWKKHKAAA